MAIFYLHLIFVKFSDTAPSICPIDASKRGIEFSYVQHNSLRLTYFD